MAEAVVGRDIDAWCNKCKLELAHIVVAMVDGVPVKVLCKTCRSEHRYKSKTAATRKKSASAAPAKSPRAPQSTKSSDYIIAMKGKDLGDAVPYSPKGQYQPEDLVVHPKFGVGIVTASAGPNKIDVMFDTETKRLVHGL
ncbi:MAG: hypothetical protein KC561_11935 [Myxococcales bacterium]|nr:hypothetical protein [Myxococcales bacterium]